MEVHIVHTIELTWPAKQMQSSLGHVATNNNQKTTGHLSHLPIDHYGKLLPLSEFLLLPGYMWPSSSSTYVGYKLFLMHGIIYYGEIFGRVFPGLIPIKAIDPSLSPVKKDNIIILFL